ncbi:dihydrofolate reductase family protein [Serratia nematodiphila]|uniref:Dihydrofolate reductase n=1 Tax=Serratia nematodiphila TaxID=458197 RepID=A0A1G5LDD0_9GAMM|nr:MULTISPECIES: dihydrofolate reductase family protein [Serratia]KFF89730.1 deaminase/reductase [Serratia nematodiphila DZ0503SBS1]MDP8823913.1 dihydrofolate reductase family protein [Serratia marcescens]UTO03724.1 dihydrofolate reductase family protein [Serratia nematodiphila]CAI1524035.1 Dihydrofolate reductase [Serratia marcescens]SCZ10882.1 Dihydrofolate reductase [Serratia nematodiphila]
MKCSVYIATSVDGFIAGPDGDIDWLLRPEYAVSLLNGLSFEAFVADIDALVMGRHTYDKVRAFPEWPYGALPVVVLSTQPPAPHATGHVRWMNGEPAAIVAQLAEQGCRHLYIDGGQTVQRFLQAGLIDELTITRVPLLLGGGIPLFDADGQEQRLRLLAVTSSDNGFVQERYAVQRAP